MDISNDNYDSYSNKDIKSVINESTFGEIYDTLYINLLNVENKHDDSLFFEFEDYVLSNYEELEDDEEKKKIDLVINSLYKAIIHVSDYSVISIFLKSKFTNEEELNRYATDEQKKSILSLIEKVRNHCKELSVKHRAYCDLKLDLIRNNEDWKDNDRLSSLMLKPDEKEILLNYLMNRGDLRTFNEDWVNEARDTMFIDLISDPDYLSESIYERMFIAQYGIYSFLSDRERCDISFSSEYDSSTCGWARHLSVINVNVSSRYMYSNLKVLHTALHESQHVIQDLELDKGSDLSPAGYYSFVFKLFTSVPQTNNSYDDEYMRNYDFFEIETDANEVAISSINAHLKHLFLKNNIHIEKLSNSIDYLRHKVFGKKPTYKSYKVLGDTAVPLYNYNIERFDEIVSGNPILIKKYPILADIFNIDGSLKTLEEFLNNDKYSIIKNDYILNMVFNEQLTPETLENLGDSTKERALRLLTITFEKQLLNMISIYENYSDIKDPISFSMFVNDINMIHRMYKIINSNYADVVRLNLYTGYMNTLDRLVNIYNSDSELNINLKTNPDYDKLAKVIFIVSNELNEHHNNIKHDRYINRIDYREKRIARDNLLDENLKQITSYLLKYNDVDEFIHSNTRDLCGNNVEVCVCLGDLAKTNMINNQIVNMDDEFIDIKDYIENLYKEFYLSKVANNLDDPINPFDVENDSVDTPMLKQ